MFLVLKLLYQSIRRFDSENKNVASENLFLLSSPLPILVISIAYWYFVKKLGPALMKNRPAFELKNVLLAYNLFQVVINFLLAIFTTSLFIEHNTLSNWNCIQASSSVMLPLMHYYYLIKVLDYMDTVFFVLRKSFKQITFLHVYHHIIMAVGTSLGIRYVGNGQVILLGWLNTYVHGVMYFYYFISALRPAMKNSLWWKKYITQMQILQFLLNMMHFAAALLRKDCTQPKLFLFFLMSQNLFMTIMFMDFYIKAYVKKSKTREALEKKEK